MNQNKDEPLKVHKLMMAVIAEVQKHQQQSAKGCHRGADEWLGLSCEHLRKWSLEGSRALVANFKSNICCRSSHLQIGVVCWETKSANLANYRPRKTWHHGSRFKHIFLAAVLCFPTMQQFVLWTPYGTEFGRWHTFRVDRRHRIDLSQAQAELSHRHKHMPRWKISTKGLAEPEIIAICMFSFSLTTERLKISDIEAGKGQPTPQLESLVEKYFSRADLRLESGMQINIPTQSSFIAWKITRRTESDPPHWPGSAVMSLIIWIYKENSLFDIGYTAISGLSMLRGAPLCLCKCRQ